MIAFLTDGAALAVFFLSLLPFAVALTFVAYKLMERPNSRAGAWLRRFFGFDD